MTPRVKSKKEKLKVLLLVKTLFRELKGKPQTWRKYLQIIYQTKRHVSRLYEEFSKLEKMNNLIFKKG